MEDRTLYKVENRVNGETRIVTLSSAECHSENISEFDLSLSRLNHPGIIQDIEREKWESMILQTNRYEIIEYGNISNLRLRQHLVCRTLSEDEVRDYFYQIAEIILLAHSNQIAHGQLTVENIIVFNDLNSHRGKKLAICNWKRSTTNEKTDLRYLPPEILREHLKTYTSDRLRVDMWSLGIILYFIIQREFPFSRSFDKLLFEVHHKIPKLPAEYSPRSKDLLFRLLSITGSARITIQELMKHPWFRKRTSSEFRSTIIDDQLKWKTIYRMNDNFNIPIRCHLRDEESINIEYDESANIKDEESTNIEDEESTNIEDDSTIRLKSVAIDTESKPTASNRPKWFSRSLQKLRLKKKQLTKTPLPPLDEREVNFSLP